MVGDIPENNNINNAAERIAPDHKTEEIFTGLDSAGARENLDRISGQREFKESSRATTPSGAGVSVATPSDDNDHLSKFFNDIDREKRDKIQELVNVVFEKGPVEGVSTARRLNDPYILDELEKLLTTKWMHKILVERGLLPEPK